MEDKILKRGDIAENVMAIKVSRSYREGITGEELYDIGWDDYLVRGGVCAVEWSENAWSAMADGQRLIRVKMARGDGDETRIITLEGAEL